MDQQSQSSLPDLGPNPAQSVSPRPVRYPYIYLIIVSILIAFVTRNVIASDKVAIQEANTIRRSPAYTAAIGTLVTQTSKGGDTYSLSYVFKEPGTNKEFVDPANALNNRFYDGASFALSNAEFNNLDSKAHYISGGSRAGGYRYYHIAPVSIVYDSKDPNLNTTVYNLDHAPSPGYYVRSNVTDASVVWLFAALIGFLIKLIIGQQRKNKIEDEQLLAARHAREIVAAQQASGTDPVSRD